MWWLLCEALLIKTKAILSPSQAQVYTHVQTHTRFQYENTILGSAADVIVAYSHIKELNSKSDNICNN